MCEKLIASTCRVLIDFGYSAYHCQGTRACFNVIARHGRELLLIKILENIDGMLPEQAKELHKIAKMLGAKALVVGKRTKGAHLRDGVLYERYGFPCFSPGSFEAMVRDGEYPEVRQFKRLTVSIDGQRLSKMRRSLGLSLSQLSALTNISRETLYRYEHEKVEATEENADKLEQLMGTRLRKPVELFHAAPESFHERTLLSFIGFESVKTRAAPFDILAREKAKLIAGEEADRRTMRKRARMYGRISEMFDSSSCFILSKSAKDTVDGIPVVRKEELKEFRKPRELFKLIEERKE